MGNIQIPGNAAKHDLQAKLAKANLTLLRLKTEYTAIPLDRAVQLSALREAMELQIFHIVAWERQCRSIDVLLTDQILSTKLIALEDPAGKTWKFPWN